MFVVVEFLVVVGDVVWYCGVLVVCFVVLWWFDFDDVGVVVCECLCVEWFCIDVV